MACCGQQRVAAGVYAMSLSDLSARTFTTLRAGFALIVMVSPVKGFLPGRAGVAALLVRVIFTRPGTVTGRPALSSSSTTSDNALSTLLTWDFDRPAFEAISDAIWALVRALSFFDFDAMFCGGSRCVYDMTGAHFSRKCCKAHQWCG